MPDTPGGSPPPFDQLGIVPVPEAEPAPAAEVAAEPVVEVAADPVAESPARVSRLDSLPDVVCSRCGASVRPWHARKADGADTCLACVESLAIEKRNRTLLVLIGGGVLVTIVAITLALFAVSQTAYANGPQRSIDRLSEAVAAGDTDAASRYLDATAIRKDLAAATHTGGDARFAELLLLEPALKQLRVLESNPTTALVAGAVPVRTGARTVQLLEVHFLMRRESSEASGTLWVVCGMPNAQKVVAQLYLLAPDLAELITAPTAVSPAATPRSSPKPPSAYLPTDKTSPYYNPAKDPTSPTYDRGGSPVVPAPSQPQNVPQTPPSGWNQ